MHAPHRTTRASARWATIATLISACATPASAYNVWGYDDRAGWAAGTNGHLTELDFSDQGPVPLPLNGMAVNDFNPPTFSITPTPRSNGLLHAQAGASACVQGLVNPLNCQVFSIFSFLTPTLAFGADLTVLPGGVGDGASFLLTLLDGTHVEIGDVTRADGSVGGTLDGFFGVVSDTPIIGFELITYNQPAPISGHLWVNVDNLAYQNGGGGGGGGTVPEPTTLALTLLGLLAAGAGVGRPRQPLPADR